ncbi:MAG: hypothetical protein M1837_002487 [Sclerophora amabilis]|nr:MAG: hypothetical protein M1837_002487 [Sclerophora amabilis]
MGDPLSITASISSILQVTGTVVQYLNDVKDSTKDRNRLLLEVSSVVGLLYSLKDLAMKAESGDALLASVRSLDSPKGPLEQFKSTLELLGSKLAPAHSSKKVRAAMTWPFQKGEIGEILSAIERHKVLFSLALQRDHITLSEAIRDDVAIIREDINDLKVATRNEDFQSFLEWLCHVDVSARHNEARRKHEPTTGAWLLEDLDYASWKRSPHSILWLHGIPGCGKTILSSIVIADMQNVCNKQNGKIAYFYFTFDDRERATVECMLRSILAEFIREGASCSEALQKIYAQKLKPTVETLIQELIGIVQTDRDSSFSVILDALDECSERMKLLDALSEVAEQEMPNLHLLMTSRIERDIEDALRPLVTHKIPIIDDKVDCDVRCYVRTRLTREPKLTRWSSDVKDDIEAALVSGAKGMFRWVVCQLDILRSCLSSSALKKALKSLPKTLDETYDRILISIDEDYQRQAHIALQWLAFSGRPLSLDEVAEAVAVNPEQTSFADEDRLYDPHDILTFCSSLVTLSHDKNLHLAHASVKDYLISERIHNGPASIFATHRASADRTIAEICVVYLLSFDRPDLLNLTTHANSPLLNYAAGYWYQHADAARGVGLTRRHLNNLILKLFKLDASSAFLDWLDSKVSQRWPLGYTLELSHLCYAFSHASDFFRPMEMGILLERGADANMQGGLFVTVLEVAASANNEAMVRSLLEKGAKVDAKSAVTSRHGGIALVNPSGSEYKAVVRLLLRHEADVSNLCLKECGALLAATLLGNEGRGYSAVAARERGRKSIPKRKSALTLWGVDVNSNGGKNGTALHAAAYAGNESMVRLLLENGAHLNAQGGACGSVLQAAVAGSHEDVVQMLLSVGADVNVRGGLFGSPLQIAASAGKEVMVRLLLDNGADANADDRSGNALQAAAFAGRAIWQDGTLRVSREEEIVSIIPNSVVTKVRKFSAVRRMKTMERRRGHLGVMRLLLRRGAKVNKKLLQPVEEECDEMTVNILKSALPPLESHHATQDKVHLGNIASDPDDEGHQSRDRDRERSTMRLVQVDHADSTPTWWDYDETKQWLED